MTYNYEISTFMQKNRNPEILIMAIQLTLVMRAAMAAIGEASRIAIVAA